MDLDREQRDTDRRPERRSASGSAPKGTMSWLNIVLALVAARVMIGPLDLRSRLVGAKARLSRAAASHWEPANHPEE